MKPHRVVFATAAALTVFGQPCAAQSAPKSASADSSAADSTAGDVVALSPFTVAEADDKSWQATTTLIGTGTLIFAKHPAIHSISLVSVLGIVCILFISFVFQPVLFDFFVQKRIAKRRRR